jgi:predicted nucleic acid-binding protein
MAFLETLEPVVVDTGTADIAGDQLARYAGSHGLQLGDALIAAAVLQHGESLATFNRKDFPGVDRFEQPAR